ncbi:vacuolar protein sorting-associated protein 11 homolog [Lycorma delicatula]|uniref:vacuolar protein sorting-associated protein 11 homolog n=1 Tax=Lycorma delicatula TaxID=130591 RepID=UPI003F5156B5
MAISTACLNSSAFTLPSLTLISIALPAFLMDRISAVEGTVTRPQKDVKINATSSGNGLMVLGDTVGYIHLITRNFTINTFRAYDRNVTLAQMSKELPFLVTIGEDEVGINPLIKVWNVDKEDRQGHPLCVRISRASLPNRAISTFCLSINNSLTFMAVGFLDGSILLYRGDIRRERTSKQKLLQEGKQSITGLAFRVTDKCTYLFVVTLISVEFYDVTHKDREVKPEYPDLGCKNSHSLHEIQKRRNVIYQLVNELLILFLFDILRLYEEDIIHQSIGVLAAMNITVGYNKAMSNLQ